MFKKILILLIFSIVTLSISAQQYHRAKITYNSSELLQVLEANGVPMDHGIKKQGIFIISDFSEIELDTARSLGAQVEVLIDDVKTYYAEQGGAGKERSVSRNPIPCNSTSDIVTPANYNNGTMGGFLTYQEMLDELDDMRTLFPNLITSRAPISDFETEGVEPAGYNITPGIGGNNIFWVRISDNPEVDNEGEPQMLYTSVHHAREPASMQQLIFYMWYLLENYETDPEVQAIVDNTEMVFVPVLNPDGYLFNQFTDPNGGGLWRKNRKNTTGVDNNRNYDYFIDGDPNNSTFGGPGTSNDPNSCVYRGEEAFSEIETQAMKWLTEQNNFVAALSNHSFSEFLLFPFGYADDVDTPENNIYETVSDVLVSQNGYNNLVIHDFALAAGSWDDFMYGTVGTHERIFSFTPEIGTSFWPPESSILGINQEMLFLNLQIAKMTNAFAKAQDDTPLALGDNISPAISYTINSLSLNDDLNNDFEVRIEAVSTNITNTGSTVNHNDLFAGDSDTGTIVINIDNNILPGEAVIFDIIVDGGAIIERTRVTKFFGDAEEVFADSGDSVTDNFINQGWGITTEEFVSPSSSITDSPNSNYGANQNETIRLADEIDLTDAVAASVSFYALWEIEAGFDYAQFEISRDGGTSWEPQCGNFTTIGNQNQDNGQPLYQGNQPDWVQENIDLSSYLGETILARFQIVTDGVVNQDGFYFDDLTFNVINDNPLAIEETVGQAFSFFPNPTNNIVNISTTLADFSTTIYNLQGQQVSETISHKGNSSIDFSNLAAGIYFVKLQTTNSIRTISIIRS